MSRPTYLGVYNNNYAITKDQFPYRVALKRYVNSTAEYTNHGYFKTEDAAAYIYNILALATFGKGAVINDVEPTEMIEEEVKQYCKENPEFEYTICEATDVLEAYGHEIKIHEGK